MSSWFTELAGKAEALLNQVDQAASDSLRDSGLKTPQKQASSSAIVQPLHVPYEPTVHSTKSGQGASVAQVLVGRTPQPLVAKKQQSNVPIHTSTPRKSSSTSSVANDDKLLEFLNSPSNITESVPSRPRTPPTQKSRKSSHKSSHTTKSSSLPLSKPVVPVLSQPHLTSGNNDIVPSTIVTTKDDAQHESSLPQEEIELEDDAVMTGAAEESPPLDESPSADMPDGATVIEPIPKPVVELETETESSETLDKKEIGVLKQKISNNKLENKLLKREINSLNEELAALLNKTTAHEERVSHYESEVHALRDQASRTDHMIRQLRSHNEDLQASLEARDSQISVLRARLSEADRKVEDQQRQLAASDNEKERFLQDAGLSSTAHSHALDSLKAQLQQHQTLLQQERVALQTKQHEFADRESRLRAELEQVKDELVGQQQQTALTQTRCGVLQTETQRVQQDLLLARQEHNEYKQRAAGILQAKEKLITSLQSGEGGAMGVVSETRLEEMRLEKEHVQAQLESALQSLEGSRAEAQESDDRHSVEVGRLAEQVRVCEGVLAEERRGHTHTRGEVTRLTQEVEDMRESLLREKTTTVELSQRSESELTSLKAQLSTTLSPSRAETESRLHELTESLIHKQTTLETLSAERNSLNLQLQRVQEQLAEAQTSQPTSNHTAVQMSPADHTDSYREGASVRPLTSVLSSLENAPTDSRLHNVKRAVNTLDKFSIRLGVFLRRYPHARLFALFYTVLLHVWVMVVLLTYSPEVHDITDPMHTNL